ncbi:molybdopterin-guanine dinucleotide biosynthesis protein B [Stappia sp. ICDLI1TA098]
MTPARPPLFGVTGWKNSGKTTLVERLVSEIVGRGLTVSTVKHAHHGVDIDTPGTDSFRHREAGAREVALVSAHRIAVMHELRDEEEPALAEIVDRLGPCDLVLIEGFKREGHPKIEARRSASRDKGPLAPGDPAIRAIATDHRCETHGLPVFDLDDVAAMADFILAECGLHAAERTRDGGQ